MERRRVGGAEQRGGEGEPDGGATSASSGADQMSTRRGEGYSGMEKEEWKRPFQPTAAGWNF